MICSALTLTRRKNFGQIGEGGACTPPTPPLAGGLPLSVQAISWVLDHSQSRGLSRLVLISIANHADKFGGEAYPATKTIAGEAGVSEREVRYCVLELEKLGEVQVDYKASKYGTNVYALAKMHPANCAGSTRQAPGKECHETRQALAPEPSLTVKRVDAPAARYYDPGKFDPNHKSPEYKEEIADILRRYPDLA